MTKSLNITEKMVLGTAQFGMDYGIANVSGKLPRKEVFSILDLAWENGIRRFDTAPDYGSEKVLGEFITDRGLQNEAIVLTKIPSLEGSSDYRKSIRSSIETSLNHLGCPVDVLFFHNPSDSVLLLKDPDFFENLLHKYSVSTLGVSVYEPKEIEEILSCQFDLAFQFPFNVLDRRFANVDMHEEKRYARSIFLQGLLVSRNNLREDAPVPIKKIQRDYQSVLERLDFDPVSLALSFVADADSVDYFLCGVETKEQLGFILSANYGIYKDYSELDEFISITDNKWLDPRVWE